MQPRGYSDEFWVSFSLPDLAFELLVSGAIAAAIIPVLASSLINNDEENGWKAVGTFLNITVIAVFIIEIIFSYGRRSVFVLSRPGIAQAQRNLRLR